MERTPATSLNPAALPVGTMVGEWRVVGWGGQGTHGTVYRAVQVDKEHSTPVALKLSLHPGDPRLAREVELLHRLRHSSIPRLWAHGMWRHPNGTLHPYFVTEWVEGMRLYDWAREHPPSTQQVLSWLAQLARALQAVHAHGAVHRDVKGANILVRLSDRSALLTDFGCCTYPNTEVLTPPGMCMGTPAYRSPEAGLFELLSVRNPLACYSAGPADDLYALGVTACRLLTGEYPALSEPTHEKHGAWRLEAVIPPPALLQSDPRLRAPILRLLSVRPEDRGTAAQVAEELEKAAGTSTGKPPETKPARASRAPPNSQTSPLQPLPCQEDPGSGSPWMAVTVLGLALALWAGWTIRGLADNEPARAEREAAEKERPDAGTRGLGEVAASEAMMDSLSPSSSDGMAEDSPPEPQPGQTHPDSKGRCPRQWQVPLNGACWLRRVEEREPCEALHGHLYKGACYVPIIPPGRPPTSTPVNPQ